MGENIRFDYEPTAKQQLFHNTRADEVLYGGAAGGGKSHACVMDAFLHCMRHPGTQAYMFRRTYPELKDTLIRTALTYIPRQIYKYSSSDHDMRLQNGSVIHFRHCNNPDDKLSYQGAEIDWLYIDELTHFQQEVYDYLKTRLRSPLKSRVRPVVRCTSNPGGPGHGWVKKYFIDRGNYGEIHTVDVYSETLKTTKKVGIQYIPARAIDNPHITQDYIFQLEQKPKALRDALLLGNWDAFEGQAFPEFVNDPFHYGDGIQTHVIDPFRIPDWWPRYRTMDWGYSRPFSVGWWAASPQGCLYRYKEWYGYTGQPNVGLKLTPLEVADGIVQRETEERNRGININGIADPACWDVSTGISVIEQMAQKGVYFIEADNSRLPGKMQVHHRLKFQQDGRPLMQVFKSCGEFLRTFPTLAYSETKVEDIDTDTEDHLYDEVRYMCMHMPIVPKEPASVKKREYNPLD